MNMENTSMKSAIAERRAQMMAARAAQFITVCYSSTFGSGDWSMENVQIPTDETERHGLCLALETHVGVHPSPHELTHGRIFLSATPALAFHGIVRMVGLGYSEVMARHVAPGDRYPERPQRIVHAAATLMEDPIVSQGITPIAAESIRPALPEDVLAVHTHESYRDYFVSGNDATAFAAVELGNDIHIDASGSTREAALTAVGIVQQAAIQALLGDAEQGNRAPEQAFCLVRPPGHHCSCKPTGFCVVNNVVVAAKHVSRSDDVRRKLGGRAPRIAVLDIDVHHGDGTQALLEEWNSAAVAAGEPPVLFVSTHRYDRGTFFPGTGAPTKVGCAGTSLNVAFDTARKKEPHRVICDDTLDLVADSLVVPLLHAYEPDIIFVSCGFDAAEGDPLGGMAVLHGFERFASAVCRAAAGRAPVIFVLEGGYDVEAVAQGTRRIMSTMMSAGFAAAPAAAPLSWLTLAVQGASNTPREETLLDLRTKHREWAQTAIAATAAAVVAFDAANFDSDSATMRVRAVCNGLATAVATEAAVVAVPPVTEEAV